MKFKDPRIAEFIRAVEERFPETTVITRPIHDPGIFDECMVVVLNAPNGPPWAVQDFADEAIERIWGDDPVPILVDDVDPERSAKYYSKYLPKPAPRARRRRPSRERHQVRKRRPARAR